MLLMVTSTCIVSARGLGKAGYLKPPMLMQTLPCAVSTKYASMMQLLLCSGCDFLVCSPYKFFGPHAGQAVGRGAVGGRGP